MEMKDTSKILYADMFGGFSLRYNGELLIGDSRERSQFTILMQEVLFHRKKGVDRQTLLKTLFGDREMEDAGHSLRNTIYMAKKRLREMGLPEADYIRKRKNFYYWTEEIEVVIDSEAFEQQIFDALRLPDIDACMEALSEAAAIYTGSFLPHMEGIRWITEERTRLQDIFRSALWQLDMRTTRKKRYDLLYDASAHARGADPYANWEGLMIKALVGLNRYEEAEKLFADSEKRYTDKFGRSSKQVRDFLQVMGNYMMYRNEHIDTIRDRLKAVPDQSEILGGRFLPLPLFRDLYRALERVMMRTKDIVFLMLCTLTDREGNPLGDTEVHDIMSEHLQNVIIRSIRYTDTVARFSKDQYLILLYGTNEENCSVIRKRILSNFHEIEPEADIQFEVSRVVG